MSLPAENIPWLTELSGKFVVVEGPDGSGKSTQAARLVSLLREAGLEVLEVREPGGTPLGERLRAVLLDPETGEIDVRTEMLLYMASRAELVASRIRPALARGACVLADRFVSSTLAYQGAAGGLDQVAIRDAARAACGEVTPDLVAIFDVDESTAAGRMGLLRDRMEARGSAYHAAVRRGYHEQAEAEPETHVLIDAARSLDHVFADFLGVLGARFGNPGVQSNSSPRNVEAK